MSDTHVRICCDNLTVGADLGHLNNIYPTRGLDHVDRVELRFEHGLVKMSSATLAGLIARGTVALRSQGSMSTDCSGSVWSGE